MKLIHATPAAWDLRSCAFACWAAVWLSTAFMELYEQLGNHRLVKSFRVERLLGCSPFAAELMSSLYDTCTLWRAQLRCLDARRSDEGTLRSAAPAARSMHVGRLQASGKLQISDLRIASGQRNAPQMWDMVASRSTQSRPRSCYCSSGPRADAARTTGPSELAPPSTLHLLAATLPPSLIAGASFSLVLSYTQVFDCFNPDITTVSVD